MNDTGAGAAGVLFLRPWAHGKKVRGADVERVNQFPLYQLGKAIRELQEVTPEDGEISDAILYSSLLRARTALARLISGEPFQIGISKAAAQELLDAIRGLFDSKFSEKDKDGKRVRKYPRGEKISYADFVYDVQPAIRKFETLFSTEMSEAATYVVPQRGIYSTAALIDFADKSFPPDIIGHIPEKARTDWKAAGRCLAFNLLSATGFHVARAVEATLEVYYQTFTGRSGTLHSWNDYLKALKVVLATGASPAPSEKTLAELEQMKGDYRNPIMHPRVVLTEIDARMLFDNGESVIIAMAAEIKTAREAGGVQGALSVVGGRPELDDEIPF
jgi:hypothetical protein